MPTAVTAFVGRALKGPVNQPVAIGSFDEYQRIFGGLWQPSTLSYAIEQFFDNGGRQAIVVRVANGARPVTLALPGPEGSLRLTAIDPGSREYLRASVDYDGISVTESDRFNLVVQRLRTPGSELIEDQEIFRRVSVDPDASRPVASILLGSRLVRVLGPMPGARPSRTLGGSGGASVGYALSGADGDDGAPLTDYDVIGSATEATGIFALQGVPAFNFLCIPPLARDQDVGLATLMVAARFCRERQALLLVDPPATWTCARTALEGMRAWPLRSDNAVMYFPRLIAYDRLRGRMESFAASAAAAGMLARGDETWPVWSAAETEDAVLRPGFRPAVMIDEANRTRLAAQGVNTLLAVRPLQRHGVSPRTLGSGTGRSCDWKFLSARRLALFVAASIEQGTRWVLFEQNAGDTWTRARSMVAAFLEALAAEGAFVGRSPEDSWFVVCDERVNRPVTVAEGRFNLLFGFATRTPGEFDTWLVSHQPGASRVRPVSVNRAATSRERVEWEIETAILRG